MANPLSKKCQGDCRKAIALAQNALQEAQRAQLAGMDMDDEIAKAKQLIATHQQILNQYEDGNYGKER